MASFYAIPTLAGQAAIAAAMMPGADPMELTQFVVGDGNGNYVPPLETQTQLVNQTGSVPIAAINRVDNMLKIDGILDETVGGFVIREAGILDSDGVLLFVAAVAPTQKSSTSEGIEQSVTLGLDILVSDTANITLVIEGTSYATHNYVNTQIAALRTTIGMPLRVYNLAVKSVTLKDPPSSPTPGDAYIVPVDATGAWGGQTGKLTQYVSASAGWIFVAPPVAHQVSDEATGLTYQRAADGKYNVVVPAYLGTARRYLYEEVVLGVRQRGWGNPFDINSLTEITPGLATNDWLAVYDTSSGEMRKVQVSTLVELVQRENIALNFFLGGK